MERNIINELQGIIDPIVEKEGFSLYDIEFDYRFLRIYIENPLGVSIDDCARMSKIIARELDHVDLIHRRYILEVSSPGIERKLKKREHYEKSLGKYIVVYLKDGKERKGLLMEVNEEGIVLRNNDEQFIKFDEIKLSRVKVDTDKLFGRKS